MKKTLLSLALSSALATPVIAASNTDEKMVFNLDNSQSMQLAVLSQDEMQKTEGEWLPVVTRIGGGLAGMYGAGYGYLAGGGENPFGFVGAAATGFAGGVWSPVTGVRSAVGTFGGAFSAGSLGTFGSGRGWW